jgi:branched-subunit amino acid aminotransferase/4-amino-4-deoxychorismate lyase
VLGLMADVGPFADLDGALHPVREIPAATDDDCFFNGRGLFETVLAESGTLPFATAHLARMRTSARHLDLPGPPDDAVIVSRIRSVLHANALENTTARLRLRLVGNELLVLASAADPDVPRQRAEGIMAITLGSGYALTTAPRHKTLDRSALRSAARLARERGAAEALIFDSNGRLLEGASSNVFCVCDGEMFTPPLGASILPGVTRSLANSTASAAGIRVHESAPDLTQLTGAAEVFLTSAIRILVPVVQIDEATIGSGQPGPVSRMILERLMRRVGAGGC